MGGPGGPPGPDSNNVDGSLDESFDPAVCFDSEDEFCDEDCWEGRYAECWDDDLEDYDVSCFDEVLNVDLACEIDSVIETDEDDDDDDDEDDDDDDDDVSTV